ncbi:ABC transporter substrate-binding protein, partial [Thioclava sp. BHET1]
MLSAGLLGSTALGSLPVLAETPAGVLVVGQVAEPKSLDPAADTAANDFRILVNIYDGLVRFKHGTLEVEPALDESWEIG